jgi:hypothetical protein
MLIVEEVLMIRSEFGKDDNCTRYGHFISQSLVFATLYLMAVCCLASDLPNNLANEGTWHPEAEDDRAVTVYSFAEEGTISSASQAPG